MKWDNVKMAQTFLQKANAIHPEDASDESARDEALALQDMNYECYISSFSRENLIRRLQEILAGRIEVSESAVDEDRYKSVYLREAKRILVSVEGNGVQ